jgi:hypothetical protein
MPTFDGATFDEAGSLNYNGYGAKAEIVVLAAPGGSPLIQSIGPAPSTFRVAAQGSSAELTALRAAVGNTAALEDWADDNVTVTLSAITGVVKVKDEADVWRFELQFVR